MRLFLSWSGDRAKAIALFLRSWLKSINQNIKPWMSEVDIEKGTVGPEEIAAQLADTNFGILILTPESQTSLWVNYEAGALSKGGKQSRPWTLLFELDIAHVRPPLGRFQWTKSDDKDDFFKLITSINSNLQPDQRHDDGMLKSIFDVWWPNLEAHLKSINPRPPTTPPPAAEAPTVALPRALLTDILETVRRLELKFEGTVMQQPSGFSPATGVAAKRYIVSAEDNRAMATWLNPPANNINEPAQEHTSKIRDIIRVISTKNAEGNLEKRTALDLINLLESKLKDEEEKEAWEKE